jgi:inosine-uridine nucleoside N-ribohydrolase
MPRRIIIDTDPGIDDAIAILLNNASPLNHWPQLTTVTFKHRGTVFLSQHFREIVRGF